MNLIDILKTIYNTKNEIRDIIEVSDDFAEYSVSVFNFLAEKYNNGYVDGYSNYFYTNYGSYQYPEIPIPYQSQSDIDNSNYDPYTLGGLIDIMRNVLGFREDIRDQLLNFTSPVDDQFVTYPDYLRNLSNNLYTTGYNDGVAAAQSLIVGQEDVEAPTATFSDNVFTMTSTQEHQSLWFKVGINGVEIRYEKPIVISSDCRIYYWASIGQAISSNGNKNALYIDCVYSESGQHQPEGESIYPPEIQFVDGKIYLVNTNPGGTMEYCINYNSSNQDSNVWNQYNGPITINSSMENIAVRSYYNGNLSNINVSSVPQTQPSGGGGDDPGPGPGPGPGPEPLVIVPPDPVQYIFDYDNKTVSLYCPTVGASIYYYIDEGDGNVGDDPWISYTTPFTIPEKVIMLYCLSSLDYGEYGVYFTQNGFKLNGRVLNLVAPQISTLSDGKVMIMTTFSGASIKYAVTDNENDTITSWTTINNSRYSFDLEDNKWVHAKTVLDGRESSVTHYYYNWYSKTYDLEPPTYSFEDNYLMISSPYSVYYTLDGTDPRINRENQWGGQYAIYGMPITYTTTINVVAVSYDESEDKTHYSPTVTWVLTPSVDVNASSEYFTVFGTSGISISGTYLYWSYDKLTWTRFDTVSGLDPGRNVYLRSQANAVDNIGTFSFTGTEVTVSGNILSLFTANAFRENNDLNPTLRNLFKNCTALVNAYDLYIPNTVCNSRQYEEMFSGCTRLLRGPKSFSFTQIGSYGLNKMFYNCSSLTTTPIINITDVDVKSCYQMFYGCSSLTTSNIRMALSTAGDNSCESMYEGCSTLSTIGLVVDDACVLGEECFMYMFKGTSSLVGGGIDLRAKNLKKKCYYYMFFNSGINTFGNLPATDMAVYCYASMFEGCTKLVSFGNLEMLNVNEYCCFKMFYGCSKLETAPVIKAPEIGLNASLSSMFNGCSKLNYIKALFLTNPAINENSHPYTYNWVKDVSPTGVFVQDANATWFEIGPHAIPTGWTVSGQDISVGEISSINLVVDKVEIYATSNDTIQYQFNGTSGNWLEYNGPITVTAQRCTIYARCINSRGITGTIKSQEIVITNLPQLSFIVASGSLLKIVNPNNIYAEIIYRVLEYGTGNDIYDDHGNNVSNRWYGYDEARYGGIQLLENYRVEARGITAGGLYSDTISIDFLYTPLEQIPSPQVYKVNNVITIETSDIYETWYKRIYGNTLEIGLEWENTNTYILYNGESWTISRNDEPYHLYAYFRDPQTGRISYRIESLYIFWEPIEEQMPAPTITCINNVVTITAPQTAEGEDPEILYRYADLYTPIAQWPPFSLYTGPFTIVKTIIVEARSRKPSYDDHYIASPYASLICEYVEEPITSVDDPVITFSDNSIVIDCSTPGCEIYYRFNTTDSWIRYRGVMIISESVTVYAKATLNDLTSNVVSQYCQYTQQQGLAAPVINYSNNTITVTCSTPGAIILYNFEGPSGNWLQYNSKLFLNESKTIYVKSKYDNNYSNIVSQYCAYQAITEHYPVEISFNNNTITLSCQTSGSRIEYTVWNDNKGYSMNGNDADSTQTPIIKGVYSGPVHLNVSDLPNYIQGEENYVTIYARPYYLEFNNYVAGDAKQITFPFIDWTIDDNPLTVRVLKATGGENYLIYNGIISMFSNRYDYTNIYYNKNNMGWLHWEGGIDVKNNDNVSFVYKGHRTELTFNYIAPENEDIHESGVSHYSPAIIWVGNGYPGSPYQQYGIGTTSYHNSATYEVYGHIMSLMCNEFTNENVIKLQDYTADNVYNTVRHYKFSRNWNGLFNSPSSNSSNGLVSAKNLILPDFVCDYYSMFKDCNYLVDAPALPATIVIGGCYQSMFENCTSLVNAPALPATNVMAGCYNSMFKGCTSLVTAPELKATTWTRKSSYTPKGCYAHMFEGCSKLNYLKVYFNINNTTFKPTNQTTTYTTDWLKGVAYGGTFIFNTQQNESYIRRGSYGVPNSWTVINGS